MTTATITTSTSTFTASVDHDGTLTISRDGVLVGTGRLCVTGQIEDCDAQLDADPEVSEEIYSQLEQAISLSLVRVSEVRVGGLAGRTDAEGAALVLAADVFCVGLHDITGQPTEEGTLPAGTVVRAVLQADSADERTFFEAHGEGGLWYRQYTWGPIAVVPWEMKRSCALDIADEGEQQLLEVARLLDVSHTRILQIQAGATAKVEARMGDDAR